MKAAAKLNPESIIQEKDFEHTTEPVTCQISQHTLKTETFQAIRPGRSHMNSMVSYDSLVHSIVEGTSIKFNQTISRRPLTSIKPLKAQYKVQTHDRQSTRYDVQKQSTEIEKFKQRSSMHELRLRKQPVKLCILNSVKCPQNIIQHHNKSSIYAKDQETIQPDLPIKNINQEQQGCKVVVSPKLRTDFLIHRKLNPANLQSQITVIKSIKLKQR